MTVRITIDGKLALTVDGLAERYGLVNRSIAAIISRGQVEHDGMLDGKKKIYLATKFDAIMRGRPGRLGAVKRDLPGKGSSPRRDHAA